jgi:hypothetical protein
MPTLISKDVELCYDNQGWGKIFQAGRFDRRKFLILSRSLKCSLEALYAEFGEAEDDASRQS